MILAQRSFASGELTPSLHPKTDYIRYAQGVKTARNCFVQRHGGLANRAGTIYSCEVKDSSKPTRLIEFTSKDGTQFLIEMGHEYLRFLKNGTQVRATATNLDASSITKANPAVVSEAGHSYSNGDEIYISDVGGMLEINNRNYIVRNAAAGTYELETLDGTAVNSSSFLAAGTNGTAAKVYELATTYDSADIFNIRYTISNNEMLFFHPNYPIYKLTKGATDISWSIAEENFQPPSDNMSVALSFSSSAGSDTVKYKVTGVLSGTAEESLPFAFSGSSVSITSMTNELNPIATATAHGLLDNDEISILVSAASPTNMGQLSGRQFRVLRISANTFRLLGVDTSNYGTLGTAVFYKCTHYLNSVNAAASITITPTFPSGYDSYNFYRESGGLWGLIGTTGGGALIDFGITPDTSFPPPKDPLLFLGSDDYPSTGNYVQQRLAVAASNNNPDKIWLSKIGAFDELAPTDIITDDGAFSFSLVGTDNFIRHILDLGKPMMLVNNGEWTLLGKESGLVTPDEINPSAQTYNGVGPIQPVIVGGNALYVQDRGSIVRDLFFDYTVDGYKGDDLTIASNHLFDNYSIIDWSYQQVPHSLVWTVRSDGKLLTLTYVKDQQIIAWCQHDFEGGLVKSTASLKGSSEDEVYIIVERTIDGNVKKYIERLASRNIDNLTESVFCDSTLVYDGRNTTATTMTVTSAGTYTVDDDLTITSSTSFFSAADIGNRIDITSGTETARLTITAYTNATTVTARPESNVPAALQATALTSWTRAIDEIYGLWHLEGKAVSVFADKYVMASPNNPNYTTLTVTNGKLTLPIPRGYINVGLPYVSDIETLDIDVQGSQTIANRKLNIQGVTIHVEDTLGVFIGGSEPTGTNKVENLFEPKVRKSEDYDEPTALTTGKMEVNFKGSWKSQGRIFLRQVDPVPMSILAISPEGYIPIGN